MVSSSIARASGSDRASRSSLDYERVAGATSGECLAKARTLAVGAGQSMVDVDAIGINAEGEQTVALRGQVLLIG